MASCMCPQEVSQATRHLHIPHVFTRPPPQQERSFLTRRVASFYPRSPNKPVSTPHLPRRPDDTRGVREAPGVRGPAGGGAAGAPRLPVHRASPDLRRPRRHVHPPGLPPARRRDSGDGQADASHSSRKGGGDGGGARGRGGEGRSGGCGKQAGSLALREGHDSGRRRPRADRVRRLCRRRRPRSVRNGIGVCVGAGVSVGDAGREERGLDIEIPEPAGRAEGPLVAGRRRRRRRRRSLRRRSPARARADSREGRRVLGGSCHGRAGTRTTAGADVFRAPPGDRLWGPARGGGDDRYGVRFAGERLGSDQARRLARRWRRRQPRRRQQ